jgi:hypothetical protein
MTMKRFTSYLTSLLLLLFLFTSIPLSAQVKTARSLVRIETPQFFKVSESPNSIYIPMGFNHADVKSRIDKIDVSRIISVSLVYTQYKASERFNQLELNNERTYELNRLIPGLASNPSITWYWIAQTGCNTPSSCNDYFHGFEIRLKSDEDVENERIEVAMMEYYTKSAYSEETSSVFLDSLVETGTSPIVKICDTSFVEKEHQSSKLGRIMIKRSKSEKKFIRKVKRKIKPETSISFILTDRRKIEDLEGLDHEKEVLFTALFKEYYKMSPSRYRNKRVYTRFDILFTYEKDKLSGFETMATPLTKELVVYDSFFGNIEYVEQIKCSYVDTSVKYSYSTIKDDVITKVFDRNMHWKNCIVATDVTGSMAPYLGQFLAWHKLHMHSNSNKDFVFFNDGNNMADILKRPGKVGGIYHVKTTSYNTMAEKLRLAQRNGGGGDGPENNIEAIIAGLKSNPSAKGVILIADNWATPRDLNLLSEVKKPIHVILCGATKGINLAYLNMVKENGGTLHTIEHDLTELAKLNEGEEVEISGVYYTIKDGKFVPKGHVTGATVRL